MLLHPGTLSRHDQRLVAVAQQFPRQDNELPLGATHGEATDNVEDPHGHLGALLSCSSSAHATSGKRAAAITWARLADPLPRNVPAGAGRTRYQGGPERRSGRARYTGRSVSA